MRNCYRSIGISYASINFFLEKSRFGSFMLNFGPKHQTSLKLPTILGSSGVAVGFFEKMKKQNGNLKKKEKIEKIEIVNNSLKYEYARNI